MALSCRENYLRNASFQCPEYMPVNIAISAASWIEGGDELEQVVAHHPRIWPNFEKGKRDWAGFDLEKYTAGANFRDAWGCLWEANVTGLEGQVIESPLENWDSSDTWRAPDPLLTADRGPVDWDGIRKDIEARRVKGELTSGGLPHGFFFMRLTYLRGFENMMIDMAIEDPRLWSLIDAIYEHNRVIIAQYLDMNVDLVGIAEDLGAQTASIIGPEMFRKYCMPTYQKLLLPCRERGCHIVMHSDGYIMDLLDDLISAGVTIINPQDLCNGIDNLRRACKGRVCICLDVDRQSIVPFGTPTEIHELVEEEVRELGSSTGGLELIAGIYPPTPPRNIDALATAFEDFQTFWFDGRGKQ